MHIEISPKKVARSDKEVFDFLTDLKNFESLIPENRDAFEVLDANTFRFALKGMPEIVLKLEEQIPNQKVVLGAARGKLPFTLTAHITALSTNESEVRLNFEGQFNTLMATMVKAPITRFMETLSANIDQMS